MWIIYAIMIGMSVGTGVQMISTMLLVHCSTTYIGFRPALVHCAWIWCLVINIITITCLLLIYRDTNIRDEYMLMLMSFNLGNIPFILYAMIRLQCEPDKPDVEWEITLQEDDSVPAYTEWSAIDLNIPTRDIVL